MWSEGLEEQRATGVSTLPRSHQTALHRLATYDMRKQVVLVMTVVHPKAGVMMHSAIIDLPQKPPTGDNGRK